MTTKRILEIEDAGTGFPEFAHGGSGFKSRGAKLPLNIRTKKVLRKLHGDMGTAGRTFEDYEALAKLKGKVI